MDIVSTAIGILMTGLSSAGTSFAEKAGEAAYEKCTQLSQRIIKCITRKKNDFTELSNTLNKVQVDAANTQLAANLELLLRNAYMQDALFARDLDEIVEEAKSSMGDTVSQVINVQPNSTVNTIAGIIKH